MGRTRWTATRRVAGVAGAFATLAAGALVASDASPAHALTVSPSSSFTVLLLGNGHGHGMSQYGARGAAIAGLTAPKIVAFYYPSTTLVQLAAPRRIKVKLSAAGTALTVAPARDLTVTGYTAPLPTTGVARLRLITGTGTGLWLQQRPSGKATWVTLSQTIPNRAEFHRTSGAPVRVLERGGTSTTYFGFLRAVRNTPSGRSGGVTVVNRVGLDNYTAGVVPREMPSTWQPAAVNAQAIAARTYGAYHLVHPLSPEYDICDTTMCQVYGGHAHYDSAYQLLFRDYPRAAKATTNQVVEYQNTPILSQFSASNGGWTVDGGLPYLTAQQDPYDDDASGDPYLGYRKTVSAASVASYFGLKTVTGVFVTSRDGNGTWRGRVLTGSVQGTDSAGKSQLLNVTGYQLAGAFGVGTTWFALRANT
jgi:SpoIID/LytB domain protein